MSIPEHIVVNGTETAFLAIRFGRIIHAFTTHFVHFTILMNIINLEHGNSERKRNADVMTVRVIEQTTVHIRETGRNRRLENGEPRRKDTEPKPMERVVFRILFSNKLIRNSELSLPQRMA